MSGWPWRDDEEVAVTPLNVRHRREEAERVEVVMFLHQHRAQPAKRIAVTGFGRPDVKSFGHRPIVAAGPQHRNAWPLGAKCPFPRKHLLAYWGDTDGMVNEDLRAMGKVRFAVAMTASLLAASAAYGQDVAPAKISTVAQAAIVPAPVADTNVDPFYASRPGQLIWLKSADSRAAAVKLPDILRRATVDGLTDGPALAATVEAALARNPAAPATPATAVADDKAISFAWVRYVQSLKTPVGGISYGDPALQLTMPNANSVLFATSAAPLLGAYVDQVSTVNPFYATLRDMAYKNGSADDPRVRASLDRLRLVPGTGKAILVDVANAELMMLENGQVVDRDEEWSGSPTSRRR